MLALIMIESKQQGNNLIRLLGDILVFMWLKVKLAGKIHQFYEKNDLLNGSGKGDHRLLQWRGLPVKGTIGVKLRVEISRMVCKENQAGALL